MLDGRRLIRPIPSNAALNDINPSQYPLEKAELRGQADASVMPSVDRPIEQAEPEPTADEAEGAQ